MNISPLQKSEINSSLEASLILGGDAGITCFVCEKTGSGTMLLLLFRHQDPQNHVNKDSGKYR